MKKTSTLLAIGSALAMGSAQAEIDVDLGVGYNSQYIFRGVDLGDDAFEWGIDASGSCECGFDWSIGVWSISPDNEDGSDDEFDIFGEISKDLGCGTLALGFTNYDYDNSGTTDDTEIYFGGTTEFAGVEAGLTLLYGVDGVLDEQFLLIGSLAYGFDVSDKISAELSVSAGYIADEGKNGGYATDDGFAYSTTTLAFEYAVSEDITFSPYVSYTDGDSSTINGASNNVFHGFYGGASVSYSF